MAGTAVGVAGSVGVLLIGLWLLTRRVGWVAPQWARAGSPAMNEWYDIFGRMFGDRAAQAGGDWLTDWMADGQADAMVREHGRAVARFGWKVRIVAAAGTLVFGAVTVLVLGFAPGTGKWTAVPFGLFASASLAMWLDVRACRIEWDRTSLWVTSAWRGRREVQWSALEAIDYSQLRGGHLLRMGSHGTVMVSDFVAGSSALVHRARAELRDRKFRPAA